MKINRTRDEISNLDNYTLVYELIELSKDVNEDHTIGIIWRKSEILRRLENKK